VAARVWIHAFIAGLMLDLSTLEMDGPILSRQDGPLALRLRRKRMRPHS